MSTPAGWNDLREPREVLGIDGAISVVGPDDVLVVRLKDRVTADQARRILDQTRQVLGKNRCLIFDELAELSVVRDGAKVTGT